MEGQMGGEGLKREKKGDAGVGCAVDLKEYPRKFREKERKLIQKKKRVGVLTTQRGRKRIAVKGPG